MGGNIGEKYLVCNDGMAMREFSRLIAEISGAALPRLRLPDLLVTINAVVLTALANVLKKPPRWGMAIDQMRTIMHGIEADGSKAERELGISYTPIKTALEEAIAWYRSQGVWRP